METYLIYINDNIICELSDFEQTCKAFELACSFCEAVNAECDLVNGETGGGIKSFSHYDEGTDEPDDIDDDYGFDPYEGCFTYDC